MQDKLRLPSANYQPFCMKMLDEFIIHFGISKEIERPHGKMKTNEFLSSIFDIMIHAMGDEKRSQILKNLDEYMIGIPAHFRPPKT